MTPREPTDEMIAAMRHAYMDGLPSGRLEQVAERMWKAAHDAAPIATEFNVSMPDPSQMLDCWRRDRKFEEQTAADAPTVAQRDADLLGSVAAGLTGPSPDYARCSDG